MLLVALAIRLDSPGPAVFLQKRVGKGGKHFTLYKFRSMYHAIDECKINPPAEEDDPRITRLGRFLRKSRLDELPQLYNILRGDMHFVGPRPFVPDQEQELVKAIPLYNQRWNVKPGATGWAQINRGYCATLADNSEKLAYDLFYIKNMSLSLDLLIMFKTMKILLLGRGGR
jgi:lipopolysaccharide/colanic/teichoic acid biosynthesis glycosyltransferase